MNFNCLPKDIVTQIISLSVEDRAYYSKGKVKDRLLEISHTSKKISRSCTEVLHRIGYVFSVSCHVPLEYLRTYRTIDSLRLIGEYTGRDIETITQLPSCSSLKELDLSSYVSSDALLKIGVMTSLRVLKLERLPPPPCNLSYLQRIETLELCELYASDIAALKTLPKLKNLNVYGISPPFATLKELTQLQKIKIGGARTPYTVAILDQLLTNFPEISHTNHAWPEDEHDKLAIALHIQKATSDKAKRLLALQDSSHETFLESVTHNDYGPSLAELRNACIPFLTTDLCSEEVLQKFFIAMTHVEEIHDLLALDWVVSLLAKRPTVIPELGSRIYRKYSFDLIARLLQLGADPNRFDDAGTHYIDYAIQYENAEALELLLKAKVPVHLGVTDFLRSALNLSNKKPCVSLLLQLGIDPNYRDARGRTVIFDCIKLFGQNLNCHQWPDIQECLSLLLDYGADVHAKGKDEISIQMYLMSSLKASRDSISIKHYALLAQKLIAKGVSFSQEDLSILYAIAYESKMAKFAQELKNKKVTLGPGALEFAASQGYATTFEDIAPKDVFLHQRFTKQNTLLHIAAACNHAYEVRRLLAMGADVSCKNENGERPIDAVMRAAKGSGDFNEVIVSLAAHESELFMQKQKASLKKDDSLDNAFSQKDNEAYLYQGTDIHHIVQSKTVQKELEHVCFIQGMQSDHLKQKLDEIFRDVDSGRPVLCVYNISNCHWASFCIVKRANGSIVTVYKDSFGKQDGDLVKLLTERSQEIKCHLGTEQRGDGTSCGIFALQNVRIMARALKDDAESFINEFKTRTFCSLDEAKQLRRGDFARFYSEGVEENERKEAEHAKKAHELALQHEPEVNQIIACLRDVVADTYTVQSQNALSGASNTIVVQIGAEDTEMQRYHYRIEKTANIDISQLEAILLCQFKWIKGKDYRIEDGVIKVHTKV